MAEQALDVAGMAALLRVSPDTVRRYAKNGTIPSFRIGSKLRFYPSSVEQKFRETVETADPWARSPQSRARRRRAPSAVVD